MKDISAKLMIVEDDPGLQSQLRWMFDGYELLQATDRSTAITELRRHEPAVVLQDLGLPPDPEGVSEGLKTLEEILSLAPYTKVIVVTGHADTENALRAVHLGAYDFYQKPVDSDVLQLIVQRAFHIHDLERQNRELLARTESPLEGIIAASEQMRETCRITEKVSQTDATVLLSGETGTGKELLARAIHKLSSRQDGPFVAINCAAIPDTLLEAELFGYEKGAYTGATKQTRGKIEHADKGTLFLDEIGDMPMGLQSKLLRFMQERTVERLGGREEIPVDVRIVCATHQDLNQLIREEKFREDLFYRTSEIVISIPPVRERQGDAIVLARSLLTRYAEKHGRPIKGFSTDAVAAIEAHDWPGNVREMENRINRAVIMSEGSQIGAAELDLKTPASTQLPLNLRQAREKVEREVISQALLRAEGNISKAAEYLGVTRPTLYNLVERYKINVPA